MAEYDAAVRRDGGRLTIAKAQTLWRDKTTPTLSEQAIADYGKLCSPTGQRSFVRTERNKYQQCIEEIIASGKTVPRLGRIWSTHTYLH